jgi:hypothetical protein
MDFTELPGKIGWLCWKLGIINFWRSTIQKKKFIKKPQALDQLLTKHKLKEKSYLIHGSGSHKHMEEIDRDLKKSKFI